MHPFTPLEAYEVAQPGKYRYSDRIGGPPQDVQVREIDGGLVMVFSGTESDDAGEEYLVTDMAGTFEGPLD